MLREAGFSAYQGVCCLSNLMIHRPQDRKVWSPSGAGSREPHHLPAETNSSAGRS